MSLENVAGNFFSHSSRDRIIGFGGNFRNQLLYMYIYIFFFDKTFEIVQYYRVVYLPPATAIMYR